MGTDNNLRASHADRDKVAAFLGEQFRQGRFLDAEEYDRRLQAATTATYVRELEPLLAELPHQSLEAVLSPKPAAVAVRATRTRTAQPAINKAEREHQLRWSRNDIEALQAISFLLMFVAAVAVICVTGWLPHIFWGASGLLALAGNRYTTVKLRSINGELRQLKQ